MLKGINPLLCGDLLRTLDQMGHGDQLLLVDRNYPAIASGKQVIHIAQTSILNVTNAILSVFPLDTFIPAPVERMEVEDDPQKITKVQESFVELVRDHQPTVTEFGVISRSAFYQRARSAFAVVHTLETAPYSCFILHKGVVNVPVN